MSKKNILLAVVIVIILIVIISIIRVLPLLKYGIGKQLTIIIEEDEIIAEIKLLLYCLISSFTVSINCDPCVESS